MSERKRNVPGIIALTLALLALGLWLGNDYGVGVDEALNTTAGDRAATAYVSREGYLDYLDIGEILLHHGPSYFMLFTRSSLVFSSLLPGWLPADGRHLTNYLTFLVGVACFAGIGLHLLPRRIAFMTTVLFATQPALFGQGFINQKDTPFMTLFLASLLAGIWLSGLAERILGGAERGSRSGGGPEPSQAPGAMQGAEQAPGLWQRIRQDWRAAVPAARWILIAVVGLLAFIVLDLLWIDVIRQLIRPAATWLHGQAWLRGPLSLVAEDIFKTPVEAYLPKLEWLYLAYGRMLVFGGVLTASLAAARWALPRASEWLLVRRWSALAAAAAGAVMGFGVSVRPIAGFAGLLASGYLIYRLRGRAAGLLLIYWAVAGAVAYETWPYLWDTPLRSFLQSLALPVDFSEHLVLYRGAVYPSDALPWHYLPTLFALQFTEAVAPLVVLGLVEVVRTFRRDPSKRVLWIGIGLWFSIPYLATLLPGAGLYNGFRHVLFLVPPLFFVLGKGLKLALGVVRPAAAQWVLFGLILLPGMWGIGRLHPYEYAYFNGYAGGMRGSYRQFDQEYWCTANREVMAYVNERAEPGAVIFFGRWIYPASPFARPDLTLTKRRRDLQEAAFLLNCSRFEDDVAEVSGEVVYEVQRGGAVFAEVYLLGPGAP